MLTRWSDPSCVLSDFVLSVSVSGTSVQEGGPHPVPHHCDGVLAEHTPYGVRRAVQVRPTLRCWFLHQLHEVNMNRLSSRT